MKLHDVLAGATVAEWTADEPVEVTELAYSSAEVRQGTLFFCVPGARANGHDFAAAAVEAGASALVVERRLELGIPQAVVADARAAMAPAAAAFFEDPTAELRVAGITGTNGKTTTAFLLRHLLEVAGVRTGLLGTVKQIVGGAEAEVERTTPEAIDLQRTFREMLDAGDGACVIEVSSHALALGRADRVRFAAATFTNLTQDHLDFHPDMDEYFQAKARLFSGTPAPPAAAIVNLDDAYGARLADDLRDRDCEPVTFSAGGQAADYVAAAVSFDASGSRFTCRGPDGEYAVELGLPGDFNVANALAALATAGALGVRGAEAAGALAGAEQVPGRLEPVDEGQPFAVLVDYAHTPDSLDNVLRAARRITSGRVICVFGAGGDRDRHKRPLMSAAAAALADLAVVNSDNPRSEDPEAILAEIQAGMARDGARAEIRSEVDRRAAIAMALAAAVSGDTVVIAGKGHEQGQEFEGGRKIPFDDRDVAREGLRGLAAP
ncbi:MAG: UDP-N-acetylmuramoyl-L-alanyl-D-glutamate--2,6-diaminopimelate ligase [Solirubrobacterales bacterium]